MSCLIPISGVLESVAEPVAKKFENLKFRTDSYTTQYHFFKFDFLSIVIGIISGNVNMNLFSMEYFISEFWAYFHVGAYSKKR